MKRINKREDSWIITNSYLAIACAIKLGVPSFICYRPMKTTWGIFGNKENWQWSEEGAIDNGKKKL